jgi:hypothetical protein
MKASINHKNVVCLINLIVLDKKNLFSCRENFSTPHDFIFQQIDNMPDFLFFSFRSLICLFSISIFLLYQKNFYELNLTSQKKIIFFLEKSNLRLFRDFIEFFKTLSIYHMAFALVKSR